MSDAVPDDLAESWERAVADLRERNGQPGVAAAVHRGERLVWSCGEGFADAKRSRPVTPTTVFRIASISKLFTAVGVLQLDEAGRVSIDEPVRTYVETFPDPTITLRHLLLHGSGVQRETPDDPGWVTGHFLLGDDFRQAIPRVSFPLRQLERWKYSNFGYNVLGEVVSRISGVPFEEYITDRVIAPLGLMSTTFDPGAIDAGRIADGFRVRAEGLDVDPDPADGWPVPSPAGQLFSTVEDIARFGAFLSGHLPGPLRGDTLVEMRRPVLVVDELDLKKAQGLGPTVIRSGKNILVGHAGGLFGYSSWMLVSPRSGFGAVMLTNVGRGDGLLELCERLIVEVERELEAEADPLVLPLDQELGPFLGRYWGDGAVISIEWMGTALQARWVNALSPEAPPMPLTHLGGNRFRTEAGPFVGETATFERASNGTVRGFEISTYRFVRL